MISVFSSIKSSSDSPVPNVNFDGVWVNELGSRMALSVASDGSVTGKYITAVGAPTETQEFSLVGFASGDLLSFTVNFGQFGSLTSWVGQHTETKNGSSVIKTMWQLAKNVPDENEDKQMWGAVLTGCNNFTR